MTTTQELIMEKSRELVRAKSDIARIEAELAEAKKFADGIENHELPELMEEAEMSEFTDLDGRKFKIKESVFVNLRKENRTAFHEWCREVGLGGIIKTKVEVPFAAGQGEQAEKLATQIMENGMQAGIDTKVESSTLRATAKKRLDAGEDWPEDIAPTTIMKSVTIKEPK